MALLITICVGIKNAAGLRLLHHAADCFERCKYTAFLDCARKKCRKCEKKSSLGVGNFFGAGLGCYKAILNGLFMFFEGSGTSVVLNLGVDNLLELLLHVLRVD